MFSDGWFIEKHAQLKGICCPPLLSNLCYNLFITTLALAIHQFASGETKSNQANFFLRNVIENSPNWRTEMYDIIIYGSIGM